jgi:4-hydroxythreonine-4-phosphate dehydrogenase
MSHSNENKPVVGFSCGDINGIGIELIIKTLSDSRILDFCTPVIFANNKVLNFYKKSLPELPFNFSSTKDLSKINPKQINLFTCWEEDISITPGTLDETGGKYAIISLLAAAEALKAGKINALVTAPIHKNNTYTDKFKFTGHTPYLRHLFNAQQVLMLMLAENMRIGLLTEHVAIKDVAQYVKKELIINKLILMHQSLRKDFGINKPRIAVLGLNPHAGDEGLIGKEELEIIKPAVAETRKSKDILCYGPYSADAFFARGQHEKFDAVLAMYHDQGLIPFKSFAIGEGVNFTAGLQAVRTSPDHGVAFDIAGKGQANESSFREAIFCALDILSQRGEFSMQYKNPLKKISSAAFANVIDEELPLE